MWIGIDDTDSKDGGCTTFICYEFVCQLYQKNYCLLDYPRLVRLNPQVPWKTRGNGAVAVHIGKSRVNDLVFAKKQNEVFYIDPNASKNEVDEQEVIMLLNNILKTYAEIKDKQTNPAFVITSKPFNNDFYQKAVHELVTIDEAKDFVDKSGGMYILMKNGRGVIGAAASLSWDETKDHTFELISYRKKNCWKTPRWVDDESVKKMDQRFFSTFDNYDYENEYNCIVPHSPCPILYGIRGDKATDLLDCQRVINSESVLGWMMFITNQGTDDHLRKKDISDIGPFQSVIIKGTISTHPMRIRGGHMFFSLSDEKKGCIDCAAYEPTKEFRKIVETLTIGDQIEVYGGVRKEPLTINIEKIKVLKTIDIYKKIENPKCPICNKHMKSKGKDQKYVCKRCHTSEDKPIRKMKIRNVRKGFYEVPVCARRHLSKPLKRMKN
jgi:tRNA(Ile2)-agmatinylcytidine synthase